MTTLTFLGSPVPDQPTRAATRLDRDHGLKYRRVECSPRRPLAANPMARG